MPGSGTHFRPRAKPCFRTIGTNIPPSGTARPPEHQHQVIRFLSFGIRRKAKGRRISYSFLFMRANGEQLSQITSLIEAGIIRPVVDRILPFEATNEALAYIETGRAKGKTVVKIR